MLQSKPLIEICQYQQAMRARTDQPATHLNAPDVQVHHFGLQVSN
jgi:hypothetical protein